MSEIRQSDGGRSPDTAPPAVSVVLITYNRKPLLRETVASILNQTFSDFELIVVDNVSEDGTERFVRSLDDPRVRYIRHPNGGVISINRNVGIRAARGDYIAFCDDDDLWVPDKLQRQIRAMEDNPRAGLCFTDGVAFREDPAAAVFGYVFGRDHSHQR